MTIREGEIATLLRILRQNYILELKYTFYGEYGVFNRASSSITFSSPDNKGPRIGYSHEKVLRNLSISSSYREYLENKLQDMELRLRLVSFDLLLTHTQARGYPPGSSSVTFRTDSGNIEIRHQGEVWKHHYLDVSDDSSEILRARRAQLG